LRARWLSAVFAFVFLGCNGTPKEKAEGGAYTAPPPSRGIVLITVDGWWDPQLKASSFPASFVPNEVRLTDAMTPSPQLRPAISSILTGKPPLATGVRNDVTTPLPDGVPLVSQNLTDKGWQTAAFLADPRVGEGSGLQRGFAVFDAPKETAFGSFRRIPHVRSPGEVVGDFSTWIASVPESASFFAWVQISRPSGEDGVSAALDRLSKLLAGTPRLTGASVALVGTAGKIDSNDGEKAGYVLNPEVLHVPVILRAGGGSGRPAEANGPFSLEALANWIAIEAGMEGTPAEPDRAVTPLIAWTWQGRDEFGWQAEIAARQGTALCVRSAPGAQDRCVPWTDAAIVESDRRASLSALDRQPPSWAEAAPVPALPAGLSEQLNRVGLRARPGSAPKVRSVSAEVRRRVVAGVGKARRIADSRKATEADAEYQKALASDPANFGVLIEAGEALALGARPGPARARLDRALPLAPSHPGAWHWLGHVAYLEKNIERADAQWQVSNVLRGGNGDVLYDLACSSSIMGRVAESDAFLRKAWAAGFRDVNQIQVDGDLRNLRADPAFLRFMREVVH
jgi:hypothetical protein